ncbi:hypothetical protein ScPMuIL_007852 [Solemya velum]
MSLHVQKQALFASRSLRLINPSVRSNRIRVMCTRLSQKSDMAAITVTPDEPLMDDKVTIVVSGLKRHEAVTLYAVLTDDKKTFASCASYVADDSGTVDLEKSPSTQGTYTGVEPLGLFWSMVQSPGQPGGTRITHKTSQFLCTHISRYSRVKLH